MTALLRIVLVVVSILNCVLILRRIRSSQVGIEDSVFWILYSGILILMSIFPQMLEYGAQFTGVQSPVNFVFLSIIFILQMKLFRMSIKISQLENKLKTFAQSYALDGVQTVKENKATQDDENSPV